MIDLEWYRTFKAIYHKGTLTGAAQELFISQPNVGQHLAALESHIGKMLFERKPRKMVPTDYGKLLYTQLVEPLEKLEKLEARFKYTKASDAPLLFIGTSHEFFYSVMAHRLGQISSEIVFEFGAVQHFTDKLLDNSLGFAFTTKQLFHKNLVSEPVFTENFILVGHHDTDITEFNKYLELKDLLGIERWLNQQIWLAYNSNLLIIRRFWLENLKKRPDIKPRFVIPDFPGILKTISVSGGVTIVPDYILSDYLNEGKLRVIWNGFNRSFNQIYLSYNGKNVTSKQIEAVRNLVPIEIPNIDNGRVEV
jgi:DNA-binding transcriptional LysR family regulator